MNAIPAFEIDEAGNLHTLYTEELNLQEIGPLYNVRRASWIIFNPAAQKWAVRDATTNQIVYTHPSRNACIAWEIENFSPGGKHYARA
jgi:hypothetical protein